MIKMYSQEWKYLKMLYLKRFKQAISLNFYKTTVTISFLELLSMNQLIAAFWRMSRYLYRKKRHHL